VVETGATVAHSHRKILAFRKRRAYMVGITVAFNAMPHGADTLCQAVTALAFRRRSIHLDQHRVVDIGPKRPFDRFKVCLVTIAR
jgi:hypothetical protein